MRSSTTRLAAATIALVYWSSGLGGAVACWHAERTCVTARGERMDSSGDDAVQSSSGQLLEDRSATAHEADSSAGGDLECYGDLGPSQCGETVADSPTAVVDAMTESLGQAGETEPAAWVPDDLYPCGAHFFDLGLRFQVGTSVLQPGQQDVLELLAEQMQRNPHLDLVEVRAYASEAPTDEAQVALSLARAHVVADSLIGLGVSADRIVVAGYGNRCRGWNDPPRTCLPDPDDVAELAILSANGEFLPGPRTCPAAEDLAPRIPERFVVLDAGP